MVPLIDMVNHSSDQPNAKLTLIDPEKDDAWFALEALRPIKAGKEIVIAYGSGVDSSSELFLNYGFVPQSNRIDEFMLKKGGDECIANLEGWTTTLEEDEAMLSMVEDDETLKKILSFRVKLKKSYAT
jgi:SET domain-containing protein